MEMAFDRAEVNPSNSMTRAGSICNAQIVQHDEIAPQRR
jgi:hypothetical protein